MNETPPNLPLRMADVAQYQSAPMPEANRAPGGGARPTVRLLNATPDPLGSLAALCGIYEGRVTRSLAEVTDEQRRDALTAMQATTLDGPLEVIQFHFLVEGVTRAFTHQAVRNRFSFFAQESLRFAVVEGESWVDRAAYPPSLAAAPVTYGELFEREAAHKGEGDFIRPNFMTPEEQDYTIQRDAWDDAMINAQNAYESLIAAGVPAEEARGVMPHAITTRYHWVVSLRTLLGEAGKRLCTQAQFEWRLVMAEIAKAIREYHTGRLVGAIGSDDGGHCDAKHDSDAWQFQAMADLLRPICYQEGKCGFMAKFDRGCTIRPRVEANAAIGRPSSEWHQDLLKPDPEGGPWLGRTDNIPAINPAEWLADPGAARVRPE